MRDHPATSDSRRGVATGHNLAGAHKARLGCKLQHFGAQRTSANDVESTSTQTGAPRKLSRRSAARLDGKHAHVVLGAVLQGG